MILPLEPPWLFSNSTKTSVGLITNGHSLKPFEVLGNSLQKSTRGNVNSSLCLHWLIYKHSRLVAGRSLNDILDISQCFFTVWLRQAQSDAIQFVDISGTPWSQVGDCSRISNKPVVSMTEPIDILLFSEDPRNHEWKVNSFSSGVAEVNSFKSRSELIQEQFWIFSLGLVHIDGGSVDEPSSLVLDDLLDGGMAVADIHLSIIRFQVKITVAPVIKEILHVTFSDNQWSPVVGLIKVREMFQPLGNDLLSIACEGLRGVGGLGELKCWKRPWE